MEFYSAVKKNESMALAHCFEGPQKEIFQIQATWAIKGEKPLRWEVTLLCSELNVYLQGDIPEAGNMRRNSQPLSVECEGRDGRERKSPMAYYDM